jgi:cellulose synthase/poly-beta-1,6-N-acetylglucosamine synthase-like glycosyltransferase
VIWVTCIALAALFYIYGGYALLIRLLARKIELAFEPPEHLPTLTVLITVFNEAQVVEDRIRNVLECRYPKERLEVLVASDGSTDGTDERVLSLGYSCVHLIRVGGRVGKSATPNYAVRMASGEIVLFTDADTEFQTNLLLEMVAPFADPRVGGVDGHLQLREVAGSDVSQSHGVYWSQENAIRSAESRLGTLAVGSGACIAVRKHLIPELPSNVGEDCVLPLEVIKRGFRMLHASRALYAESMEHEPSRELRARIRMTLRNWQGTWMYAELLNPIRHPAYAWALWSHKLLRWLSPFILLLLAASAHILAFEGYQFGVVMSAIVDVGIALALTGWIAYNFGLGVPIAGRAFSFALANLGFLLGVSKALLQRGVEAYGDERK